MELSKEKTLRALRIVASFGRPCEPREFARMMWPDSPKWDKPAKRPRDGITHGAVMNTVGAGCLGSLERRYLVQRAGKGYELTASGKDYLARQGEPPQPGASRVPAAPAATPLPPAWIGVAWPHPVWDGRAWVYWDGLNYQWWHAPSEGSGTGQR